MYKDLKLPRPTPDTLFERLRAEPFAQLIDPLIIEKIHAVRIVGNKAAHGRDVASADALCLVKDAYLIGQWLLQTYNNNANLDYPEFEEPKHAPTIDSLPGSEEREQQLSDALEELSRLQAANAQAQSEIARLQGSIDQERMQGFMTSAARAAESIDFEIERTRSLISIHDVFAKYELNAGQAELVTRLERFLSSRDESIFLLKGYAGTGKTFITKGLTEYFRSIGRNFELMAPTGKASKVIATKARADASTIHGAIYSFKDIVEYRIDDDDGTATYKYYADLAANDLSADTVFIVDEASMVSDNYQEAEFFRFGSGHLLRDLLKYVNLDHNDHRKKIIFIGDNAQLPPVGMSSSPALSAEYLKRECHLASVEHELKEIVRQKSDSGVIDNSIRLRDAIRTKTFNQLTFDFSKSGVEKLEHRDFMRRYLEACNRKIAANTIVIAHSNSDVAEFNKDIREHFFPGCAQATRGDKIIAVTNTDVAGFFISNGDFGMIREVLGEPETRIITLRTKDAASKEVIESRVTLTFRDLVVAFRDPEGTPRQFQAKIIEDLLYSSEPNLTSDQSKALYIDFCIRHPDLKPGRLGFKNALRSDSYFNALRLKFGYAITCHKAQGSEWEHTFVKCKTGQNQLSAGYFRWLYTAITRTSDRLYLLDAPDIKGGGPLKDVGANRERPAQPFPAANSETLSPGTEPQYRAGSQEVFGIPATDHLLLSVLDRIRGLLAARPDAEIESISHNQYCESYFFRCGNQHARIDISYNNRGKLSIRPHISSEFSADLMGVLAPLNGTLIAASPSPSPEAIQFEHEFLKTFHLKLTESVKDQGIVIDRLHQQAWRQRYSFRRSSEIAVLDIFYNGRHQFKSFAAVDPLSNSKALVADVAAILATGFD